MKKPLQNTLKTSLSAIALIVSGQGLAQENETKEVKKAPEVELIQVVGIRSSLE
ncbi:hypothetical protein [Colwellia sp. UCD-KL20]|uniref:hypothetical protein n=1 Tax=Colwellia sp. UCD-KL20 TaxID=1917165 RepID=UPI0015C3FC9B|nr:hypothetical protein [Colwellia sp. UCD-KL20]